MAIYSIEKSNLSEEHKKKLYIRKCLTCEKKIKIKIETGRFSKVFSDDALIFYGGNKSCWICNKCIESLEKDNKIKKENIGYSKFFCDRNRLFKKEIFFENNGLLL